MEPVRKLGLPLFDAICAWCDQALVPEFRQLTKEGFDDEVTRYLASAGREQHKVSRYEELHEKLVEELHSKLCTGVLTAMGFDSRAAIDAPAKRIPAERWPLLTINRDLSVTFDGLRIIGIKVNQPDDAEFAARVEYPSAAAAATEPPRDASLTRNMDASAAVRLVITKGSRQVSFDGKSLTLSALPLNLLLVLAEAVFSGEGPLPTATLKERLVSSASDSVVGDAVRYLRRQLNRQIGPGFNALELVQNRQSRKRPACDVLHRRVVELSRLRTMVGSPVRVCAAAEERAYDADRNCMLLRLRRIQ